jgi:chemotaxis signal transduction protein
MSSASHDLSNTVLAMRREFDLSFAQAPNAQTAKPENFLGIRLGDDAYAIRTAEIGGLHVDCRVMPLPTSVPAFLGVAGFRGLIAPVYDLAKLLGYASNSTHRWVVLVRLGEPIAFAFETFESHFSADSNSIIEATQIGTTTPGDVNSHLLDAVRIDAVMRPIIHLQSLIEAIQRTVASSVRPRSNQA